MKNIGFYRRIAIISLSLGLLILGLGLGANAASVLTLSPSGQNLEDVPISSSGILQVEGRSANLTTVGYGIRKKSVFVTSVNVYVAQLLVNDPARLDRTDSGALMSLDQVGVSAIALRFLRDVDSDRIETAFQDGLENNGSNLSDPAVTAFMNLIRRGGDVSETQDIVISGERIPGAGEKITVEFRAMGAQTFQATDGSIKKIFALWLGRAGDDSDDDDDLMDRLRKALLGRGGE